MTIVPVDERLRAYGKLLQTAIEEFERAQEFTKEFEFVSSAEISVTFGTLDDKTYKLTISEPDVC